ncbi:MAG TPA: addiction module protein [Puia sp.]|nr:addiction module protein [Puia sp.]
MTTAAIRKKLTDYLKVADEQKVKAIYTMVKDEIDTDTNDWSPAFIKELDRRRKEVVNGSAQTYSWEETKKAALGRVKSKKK